MSKILVETKSKTLVAHENLDSVVAFLLKNGCSLKYDYIWGSNREGYVCDLVGKLNFEKLERHFKFPVTVKLIVEKNIIYDEVSGCIIKGG
jgi:hypothetical protein